MILTFVQANFWGLLFFFVQLGVNVPGLIGQLRDIRHTKDVRAINLGFFLWCNLAVISCAARTTIEHLDWFVFLPTIPALLLYPTIIGHIIYYRYHRRKTPLTI